MKKKFTKFGLPIVAGCLLVLVVFMASPMPIFYSYSELLSAVVASILVDKTNDTRLALGQNTLQTNPILVEAAQLKADDMASKGYFAHNSPDGKTPWYWLNLADYKYKNAGENLAVNFTESSGVFNGWMNSPTHRANIIRSGFSEIGIATSTGMYKGREAIFVVQFFGEPVTPMVAIATTSKSF